MNELISPSLKVTKLSDGKARLQLAKYWQEIFNAPLNLKGDDKLLDNAQKLLDIYSLDEIRSVFKKAKNLFSGDKWGIKNLTPSYLLDPKHFADVLGRFTPDNAIDVDTSHGLPKYTEKIKEIPRLYLIQIIEHYTNYETKELFNTMPDKDLRNIIYKYSHWTYQDKDGDWAVLGLGVYK